MCATVSSQVQLLLALGISFDMVFRPFFLIGLGVVDLLVVPSRSWLWPRCVMYGENLFPRGKHGAFPGPLYLLLPLG